MRLNLYWRGVDLIDVEVHLFRPRAEDAPAEGGPVLEADGNGNGQFELAEPLGAPDTSVRIGFR